MIHFVESDSGNESEKEIINLILFTEEKMKTTLIIMAAGIGSRFGTGIKQLAKMAPQWGDYYGFFDLRCERSRFYKSCFCGFEEQLKKSLKK